MAGATSGATALTSLRQVLDLPIELDGDSTLHLCALELAGVHRSPAAYDAHYLALAERFRAPLWTCDRRLAAAVADRLPRVHLVV